MQPLGNGTSNQTYRYLPPVAQPARPVENSSYRPRTQTPAPAQPRYLPPAAPAVKLDRIVALPHSGGVVQGQVVRNDQRPRSNAQVMFVAVKQQAPQQTVTANQTGQFRVSLASGSWLVYVNGQDVRYLAGLDTPVSPADEVRLLPAMAGG